MQKTAPHHIDEADAMLLQRFHVAGQVAPRQDAAVHTRVQGFDAPCTRMQGCSCAGKAQIKVL